MRTEDLTPEEELRKLRSKGGHSQLGIEVAGAAGGAAIGALTGAIAGPPGAAVGAIVGAAVGGMAGFGLDQGEQEHRLIEDEREAELEAVEKQRRSSLLPSAPTK